MPNTTLSCYTHEYNAKLRKLITLSNGGVDYEDKMKKFEGDLTIKRDHQPVKSYMRKFRGKHRC